MTDEEMDDEQVMEKDKIMFLQLIMGLQSSAWISLGKVPNPFTGKIERNLTLAKSEIDMLMMLKEKTKGNLDDDEEKTLSTLIGQLQINFVAEMEKPDGEPPKEDEEKQEVAKEEKGDKKIDEKKGEGKGSDKEEGKKGGKKSKKKGSTKGKKKDE